MNPAALRLAVRAALAEGAGPEEAGRAAAAAAAMASRMAEMVGWSIGPIDADGALLESLRATCHAARERFESSGREPAFAGLHDAIAELAEAIAAHDRDLEPAAGHGQDLVAF